MNKCPITYKNIIQGKYSNEALRLVDKRLTELKDLPFTKEELLLEAAERSDKMSIQGVQAKLSAILSVKNSTFEIVDTKGTYILKPQNVLYEQLPENEDLTMKLASTVGIEVPLHGLIYAQDSSLVYFIKRFDRYGKNKKYPLEDFAQLSLSNRDTKYSSSMEKVAQVIEQYCSFPYVEKVKFFRLTLFNYLTGNEDMHLKNFSLITHNNKTELTPAYDLLNTTIAMKNPREEIALPLQGKKSRLNRADLIDYFARERLSLNDKIIEKELSLFINASGEWLQLIESSFLSDSFKQKYLQLISKRKAVLSLS